jgi:hypothetical protein
MGGSRQRAESGPSLHPLGETGLSERGMPGLMLPPPPAQGNKSKKAMGAKRQQGPGAETLVGLGPAMASLAWSALLGQDALFWRPPALECWRVHSLGRGRWWAESPQCQSTKIHA